VKETNSPLYTPSITYLAYDMSKEETKPGPDIGPLGIGEGKNSNYAKYTNTRATVTPTGVNVDDLPYVALIALVLVALGGYIVFAARKRSSNNA
jgi:hypothetical protein